MSQLQHAPVEARTITDMSRLERAGKNEESAVTVPDDSRVELYEDAYQEAKRSVDAQMSELDSMRARAISFVAFVGSATAFLIGSSLKATEGVGVRPEGFYFFSSVATILSALTVVALIGLLLTLVPWIDEDKRRRFGLVRWNFRMSATQIMKNWVEPKSIPKSHYFRSMALVYDRSAEKNMKPLRGMRTLFAVVLVCGSLQLVAWSALLWTFG